MLIAVPGWPLPTFWTASMASTRTVSMARRSRSPKPSGRVGRGWRGEPVDVLVAASAGASDSVLCVAVLSVAIVARCSLGSGLTGRPGGRWAGLPGGRRWAVRRPGPRGPPAPRWTGAARRRRRRPYPLHAQHQRDETLVMPTGRGSDRGLQLGRSRPPVRRDLRAVLPPGGALSRGGGGLPVTAVSERPVVAARRLTGVLAAYVALTKPRIIELLLVTTLPAMMLAARGWPSWSLLAATMVGGTLAAGAANVFNCWYDRDIDRLMHRTERRPLPMGEVSPRGALVFGLVLTVVSVALLAATTTPLAAVLALAAIVYYAVVYTMVLKRHTRHSTLFGGVPGAAPVLIGWAAVTGSLAWPAVVFFGVVFCWQLPHFWALAMRFRE